MSEIAADPVIAYKVPKRRHPVLQFAITQPLGFAGLIVIIVMFVAGVFAKWVAPYDPLAVDYGAMLAAPSLAHPLGTDAFGRDVFSRVIYGARTALMVGFFSSFIGSTIGAVIGVVPGILCKLASGAAARLPYKSAEQRRLAAASPSLCTPCHRS